MLAYQEVYRGEEPAVLAQRILSTSTSSGEGEAELTRFAYAPVGTSREDLPTPCEVKIWRQSGQAAIKISYSGSLASNLREVIEQVANILTLEEGWNSHSAKPIKSENARAVILLLAEILTPSTPPPTVVPRVRGGIQLDWSINGIDLEIYVDSPSSIRFFAENVQSGETLEATVDRDLTELQAWLDRLSS